MVTYSTDFLAIFTQLPAVVLKFCILEWQEFGAE